MTSRILPASKGFPGLARLAPRLIAEDGFKNREAALEAICAYERFFSIVANRLGETFVPSCRVDIVWQRHMLDTIAYERDCSRRAGGYIHRQYAFPAGAFERCVELLGVAGEALWRQPGAACTRIDLAAPFVWTRSLAALGQEDFSDLLEKVRSSLRQKASDLPWIAEALKLLDSDPSIAIEEYKRFLELLIREEGYLTPSKLVDEFWHQHILDSHNYFSFCSRTAGRYLHHVPRYEKPHSFHVPGFDRTKRIYQKHFGFDPSPQVWAHMGECEPSAPLYADDSPASLRAKIDVGGVKKFSDRVPRLLKRKGMPLALWNEFLHAVASAPPMSFIEAVQKSWVVFILSSAFLFLWVGIYLWLEINPWVLSIFGPITVFVIAVFRSWAERGYRPQELQRIVTAYAREFARFDVAVTLSENGSVVVIEGVDHELEEKARRTPSLLSADERRDFIGSSFHLLSSLDLKKESQAQYVPATLLAFFGVVVGGALGLFFFLNKAYAAAYLIFGWVSISLILAVLFSQRAQRRFLWKKVLPELAKSLRPFTPTESELQAALEELKPQRASDDIPIKLADLLAFMKSPNGGM